MNRFGGFFKSPMWLMAFLLAALLAGCGGDGGSTATSAPTAATTAPAADTTAPTVSSTVPANAGTGAALDASIAAIFSEAMNAATITTTTFALKQGATVVPGAVSYAGTTATFKPTGNLTASTLYTATVSTEAKDLAGNALAAAKTWSFTTGLAPDTTAPTVVSTNPGDTTTGVALGGNIAAIFSEAMDPSTITTATFTLKQGTTVIPGAVSYVGTTATLKPNSNLAASTLYTATMSTGAKDLAGNALAAAKTWTFTTGLAPDTTAPTASTTVPASAGVNVPVNANITATFSEAMDPLTITTATFTLKQGTTVVPGAVTSPSTTTATFDPTSDLANSTVYTATISTGAKDLAGNALAADKTWSFTTGAAVAQGPAPVILGTAGNFAILTKTGITNVGPSAITGSIGSSPITGAAMTGLTCTQVSGTVFTTDATGPAPCSTMDPAGLTTAVSDMETAYTDAAGRVGPDQIDLGSGLIGGLTLTPGLYKWSTGVSILSNVTLNGGPNDVWIFQVGGVLSQAIATNVMLTGGAQAKNIFWQVVNSAGLNGHLEGIVLSATTVTLGTGASVNGRLLAQTAVTLNQNTVTQPAP